MICFTCPQCGKGFQVEDKVGGRKAKCPKCATIITVPLADVTQTSPPASAPTVPATTPVKDTFDDVYGLASEPSRPPVNPSGDHPWNATAGQSPLGSMSMPNHKTPLRDKSRNRGLSLASLAIGGVLLVVAAVGITLWATGSLPNASLPETNSSSTSSIKTTTVKTASAASSLSPVSTPSTPSTVTVKPKYVVKGEIFVTTKGGDVKKAAGLNVSFTPITAEMRQSISKLLAEADQIEAESKSHFEATFQKYPDERVENMVTSGWSSRQKVIDKARDKEFDEYNKTTYWPRIKPLNKAGKRLLTKDAYQTVTSSDGTFSVELPAGEFLLITEQFEIMEQKLVWCKVINASENSRSIVINQKFAVFGRDVSMSHYRFLDVSVHDILLAAAKGLGLR